MGRAPERLKSAREVVCRHEVSEVRSQLVVTVVIERLTVASLIVRFIRST